MKSVSVVEYVRGTETRADSLTEVARHFATTWATAVALVDTNTFLESDAEGNVAVLSRDVKGVTGEDRRRLRVTSEMHLGEMVNRIRPISVMTSPDATVLPRAFLATVSLGMYAKGGGKWRLTSVQVEGSIYLFALIAPAKQDLLMRLQGNMAGMAGSVGGVPFAQWRGARSAVRESEEPFRFVDGELIEHFLDCGAEVQEAMVEGLGAGVEEVRAMVEGLRRLR